MPYLYASPDDHFCQLRGFDEDGDEGGDEGGPVAGGEGGEGGAGGGARVSRRFWDGSRDRWISVVSARVDPDAVRAPPAPARRPDRRRQTCQCSQDLTGSGTVYR
jgi:hypothetical protein